MASYEFQALTTAGTSRRGFMEADSERHVRQCLRDEGLLPVSVRQATARPVRAGWQLWRRPIPPRHTAMFARQLASLVDAGIPLEEALQACADQTTAQRMRKVILHVRSQVREGHTLADSLRSHSHVFNPVFVALVNAGEHSGDLAKVLIRLADYLEDNQTLHATLRQGLAYPAVLTVVAIGVVAILMSFVVPKVIAQFDHMQQALPLLTRILIATTDATKAWGAQIAMFIVLLLLSCRVLLRNAGNRSRWHKLLLRLPITGSLIISINSARLMRTLSILTSSGVPLLEALRVGRETLSNDALRNTLTHCIADVEAGSSLHHTLQQHRIVPPIALYMIANGEKTGELDNMLDRAALSQERQLESHFKLFLTLFEPALIIILGGVVLMIVLAIMLPILQLNNFTTL